MNSSSSQLNKSDKVCYRRYNITFLTLSEVAVDNKPDIAIIESTSHLTAAECSVQFIVFVGSVVVTFQKYLYKSE